MHIHITDGGATMTISPEEMNRILEKCSSEPCSFFADDQEREDAMRVFAPKSMAPQALAQASRRAPELQASPDAPIPISRIQRM